ncbi:hypothetical protein BST97_14670 [Nonlabens spongiae]|uniref:Uncharacterized protein n=1 Tax=Nonlabens spongiae TaxID=331648 RepID=A0A1W6MNH8_9FLAO|nr:hypothetical protein [Nonlabens spongiae]ARN79127.1 hypothetical protein BST97_14670 [Nonlabens spongiae]
MKIFRNIAALVVGWLAGSAVNMSLVTIGPMLIPLPDGVNPQDMEAYAEISATLGDEHFIFPFLAHALGTLVGATVAYLIAATSKNLFAWIVGAFFLLGGIMVNYMIPGPLWFTVADLVLAYIPMAFLGIKIGEAIQR